MKATQKCHIALKPISESLNMVHSLKKLLKGKRQNLGTHDYRWSFNFSQKAQNKFYLVQYNTEKVCIIIKKMVPQTNVLAIFHKHIGLSNI